MRKIQAVAGTAAATAVEAQAETAAKQIVPSRSPANLTISIYPCFHVHRCLYLKQLLP